MTNRWRMILALATLSPIASKPAVADEPPKPPPSPFLFSGTSLPGASADDAPTDEAARASTVYETAKVAARAFELRREGGGKPFTLHPEPILKWSNPVAGALYGNVYIWTEKGRPEAIVSMARWYSPLPQRRNNEFHSLSPGTFVAWRDGERAWAPSRPGVEIKDIPGAPTPGATPAQRLRQMRALAAEFGVRQTDRKNVASDLRLLTQPLYRYEKTERDLIDGSLFVFVQGTDPQAFLMVEDRMVDGSPRWRFAMARMVGIHLAARFRGEEVWSVPTLPWSQIFNPTEPYAGFSSILPREP
jgi:hypothetical protein